MHHIVLSSVACLALPYFSTLSDKWHYFWKNVLEQTGNMCVLILSAAFISNISHSQKNSADIIINVHRSSLFSADFNET
jgi:hypothetical protein